MVIKISINLLLLLILFSIMLGIYLDKIIFINNYKKINEIRYGIIEILDNLKDNEISENDNILINKIYNKLLIDFPLIELLFDRDNKEEIIDYIKFYIYKKKKKML